MITAIVLINADRKAIPELGAALAAIDGVSEVYSVTGEVDFVAMVREIGRASCRERVCNGV